MVDAKFKDPKAIGEKFMAGIDCSQVVMQAFAGKLGLSENEAKKMMACFGGGVTGEMCGAVVASLTIIGLKYGHFEENNAQQKAVMAAKRGEFLQKYTERHPSIRCKEILGYDLTKPEELQMILDKGLMFSLCPMVVKDCVEILEELLD